MNEADNKVKAQIVEKIKASTNILVTVSNNPSVDELSAALGLTVFLNKLDKHATAIFSGIIPPAISFLEPDKIFEDTANSLRDFIIALDKEKADHLRYKIEGDVVKIFITPYRTTISEKDLEFSQGDYNIELVLALGVQNQEDLDAALAANGQIFHDVTISTFSAGEQESKLGSMDWRDQSAGSQSEMVADICNTLKTDKVLIDKQIATSLLTGIVSATERFSNPKTTSRIMTLAAQLMAAGADQQLIAAKLQESHEIGSLPNVSVEKHAAPSSASEPEAIPAKEEPAPPSDILSISHDTDDSTASLEQSIELPQPIKPEEAPAPTVPSSDAAVDSKVEPVSVSQKSEITEEPLLGGILNATSDQAADDARRELDEMQNKTILSHSYLGGSEPSNTAPINGVGQSEESKIVDIFAESPQASTLPEPSAVGLPLPPPLPDFSTLPPSPEPIPAPAFATPSVVEAASTIPPTADIAATTATPAAASSTLPDFSAPYAVPLTESFPSSTLPAEPGVNDPSKFQIPV